VSNTIRDTEHMGYFRHPKGFKNATINDARSKAVPPTFWDDMKYSHNCYGKRANAGKKKNPRINGG